MIAQLVLGIDGTFPTMDRGIGWVHRFRPLEELISTPEHPVVLEVQGYPETRSVHEKDSLIKVRIRFTGVPDDRSLIFETSCHLWSLLKKPELVLVGML